MNDLDIETLLHTADAPRMRVDTERVLAGGKHKVQRRRAIIGGGLLAAAVAVGAVGASGIGRATQGVPLPAGPTHTATRTTTTDSAIDGVEPSFTPEEEDPLTRMVQQGSGSSTDPASTYHLERTSSGDLRITRTLGKVTVALPTTATLPGGGVQTVDRGTRLVALPAPADAIHGSVVFSQGSAWASWRGVTVHGAKYVWGQSDAAGTARGAIFQYADGTVTTNTGASGAQVDLSAGWRFLAAPTLGLYELSTVTGSARIPDGKRCIDVVAIRTGERVGSGRVVCVFTTKPSSVGFNGAEVTQGTIQPLGSTGRWLAWGATTHQQQKPTTSNSLIVGGTGVTSITWKDASGTHTEKLN